MLVLDIYKAAKAYYDKGGKWGQRHYNSAGACCFVGAAHQETGRYVSDIEGDMAGKAAKVIQANDYAKSKEEALERIADILEIPEEDR